MLESSLIHPLCQYCNVGTRTCVLVCASMCVVWVFFFFFCAFGGGQSSTAQWFTPVKEEMPTHHSHDNTMLRLPT